MRNISKFIFFIIFNCCFIQTSIAQTSKTNSTAREILLPPLEDLIEAAIKHNPTVEFTRLGVELKESLVKSERKSWTNNFGLQADAAYGNINNSAYSLEAGDNNLLSTSTTQLNYGAGVYLKFPVFDIVNRNNQIQQAQIEVDQAKSLEESMKNEIRTAVIVLYQDLILKQKILQIKSRSLGDARVNLQMVEKEFRNGIVPLSEHVRISGMTTSMEEGYETAMSEFITAKKLLEDMTGIVFGLTHSN